MSIRGPRFRIVVWLCVLSGSLVLGASMAQAAVKHEFLPELSAKLSEGVPTLGPHGEAVPVPGPIGPVVSMTVDSGELYVTEGGSAESRIDKFDASSGAFLSQLPQLSSPTYLHQGVAVGRSTGEAQVYVAGDEFPGGVAKGVVAVLSPAGSLEGVWQGADTPAGAFGCFNCLSSTASVAVDGSKSLTDWAAGDVYVTDSLKKVVDVFKPERNGGEKYVAQLVGPEAPSALFHGPVSVAVNQSNGEVVVTDNNETADVFKPAAIADQYEFLGELKGPGLKQGNEEHIEAAIDSGNGDIYIAVSPVNASSFVDEFDSEGKYVGDITNTPGRDLENARGITVDPETHDLYLTSQFENKTSVVAFGPDIVVPDVTTTAATEVTVNTQGQIGMTLNGTVDPDKEGAASCWFEFGASEELGQRVPCEPETVAESGSPVAVHAKVSGLKPDTTYFYRLQASGKNGTNLGEPVQNIKVLTPGPGLLDQSASSVAASSATLNATIDSRKALASYYFQYGSSVEYGSDVPAAPGAALGSSEAEVSQYISGLSAGMIYHYRVVVVSEVEGRSIPFYGPDETFTTQTVSAGSTLLDSREWEMISPPEKDGALVTSLSDSKAIQSSADGNAVTFVTSSPTEGQPQGYTNQVQVFATRGTEGWQSRDISVPHEESTGPATIQQEYQFFSEDLSMGLVHPFGRFIPSLSVEASEPTPYLRKDFSRGDQTAQCSESCYRPLVTGKEGYANVPPGTEFGEGQSIGAGDCPPTPVCGPDFYGATPDLSHVVMGSKVPLIAGAAPGAVYEWSEGKLALVSVPPGAEPPTSVVGRLGSPQADVVKNAISRDGSRVFWTENRGGNNFNLNMRDMVKKETIRLNTTRGGSGAGEHETAQFMAASSDGTRVFFTDTNPLTKDAAVGHPGDMYECEIVEVNGKIACKLSDVTPVNSEGEAAKVLYGEISGTSEDDSWLYFAANGVLAPGAIHGDCVGANTARGPEPGRLCNLYVWHDGVIRLVAVLSNNDYNDWAGDYGNEQLISTRVSPNGKWLAFMSQRELTGYNTRDAVTGLPDEEVYLYDAEAGGGAGHVTCASCNPSGARPVGIAEKNMVEGINGSRIWAYPDLAASIPTWQVIGLRESSLPAAYQSRYLSDSGRLFFNAHDALVPQDVNGTGDVYEYEPPGVGDCSLASSTFSPRSDGCVGLISSGGAAEESGFLDASESGGDVFFFTAAKLSPADFDSARDVYDAHECSSSAPCYPAVAVSPPTCSTGDACKPAPTPQPTIFGLPASATFNGTGDLTPSSAPLVKPKGLTRAQKLARALKACHVKKKGKRRVACERAARRQYGGKTSRTANTSKMGQG